MEFDVHVWLQSKQISHTEDARINRGGVLYFEGTCDGTPFEQRMSICSMVFMVVSS
jgi:hypothetical protein